MLNECIIGTYTIKGVIQLLWTTPTSNNIYSIINTKYLYFPYYIHT